MARQPRSLRGKVVVITGGAQGIGARTAEALAGQGARVVLADLDEVRAGETASEIGERAVAYGLDVTDSAAFTALLDRIEQEVGPVDVLINNAGIMPLSLLEDEDDTATRKQLEINLHAVVHGTREAVRRMRPRGAGHIVNISSMAGKSGFPGGATYCATKHGVVGLSESVRYELRGSGVEVSCVLPAIVRTELASGLGESSAIKPVAPEDVAAAVVRALSRPRFDVYVPASLDIVGRITRLLPRRAGEWITHALGGDRILSGGIGSVARKNYEDRAAHSAPRVE